MKKITSKKELYSEFIKDMYSAKVHEVAALNFFENNASSPELKELLHMHTGETRMQVLRLEDLFDNHKESVIEHHCRTMQMMIREARELVERCNVGELRDFAIRSSVQGTQCELMVHEMLVEMAGELMPPEEIDILRYNQREDLDFNEELDKQNKPIKE